MAHGSNRFCVGVDFGTTYTSVAFAHSSSPNEVKLVQSWPNSSAGDSSADQVPTVVQYRSAGGGQMWWGYQKAPPNTRPMPATLQWFKLLLQMRPNRPRRNYDPQETDIVSRLGRASLLDTASESPPPTNPAMRTAQALEELGIQPIQVVADFLRAVRELAVASIQQTYQAQWVTSTKISYILTVPAIWTDSAKNVMVQAAEQAGFGAHRVNFQLISEPEAAAAYTLKVVQPNDLKVGDNFVICDAGGGTVDLISYKITSLNPLCIDESVCGTGQLCGSVYLDEGFEQYMRRRFGDSAIDRMKPRSRSEMMRTWEEKVKFKFGNATSESLEVTVAGFPDNPALDVEEGFHVMDPAEVKKIFDPIVGQIVRLVEQQVMGILNKGENVAAILLVGGFGSSQYLLQRLEQTRFRGRGAIPVLQPVNARSAIARGALIRGLEGSMVDKRRSRRHYGYVAKMYFDSSMPADVKAQKIWDVGNDTWMIPNHYNWYIRRNQIIGRTVSITFPFTRMIPIPKNGTAPGMRWVDVLWACDLEGAPDYAFQNPGSAVNVCQVISDLSTIPLTKFRRKRRSDGNDYLEVPYDMTMNVEDEVIKFELIFEATRYGVVTTRFEGE